MPRATCRPAWRPWRSPVSRSWQPKSANSSTFLERAIRAAYLCTSRLKPQRSDGGRRRRALKWVSAQAGEDNNSRPAAAGLHAGESVLAANREMRMPGERARCALLADYRRIDRSDDDCLDSSPTPDGWRNVSEPAGEAQRPLPEALEPRGHRVAQSRRGSRRRAAKWRIHPQARQANRRV